MVEVADTSLAHDRTRKHAVYARAAIPEYWIVNLIDRTIEVHSDPSRGTYRTTTSYRGADIVTASIRATDLRP